MLSLLPLDVLDEIWDVIESVSEGFLPTLVLPSFIVSQSLEFGDFCLLSLIIIITLAF